MKDKYFGIANHLVRDYNTPPKEIWWRLCPGSYTANWIKRDKEDFSLSSKTLGYILCPIGDAVKTIFEGFIVCGAMYGLYKLAEEISKTPFINQGLENIFHL